ncbi:hypothetical protein NDU88_007321 [Pleurodeles waltl]|uniref:CCHC-type domain-containing protein n=1 Tax=Pleurodeles waltl TaxID=8319 RepID=A0AAV7SRZ7_PLEWA|nr:hypothetical protein NDU88_007321 [Pleurodeles waltl]
MVPQHSEAAEEGAIGWLHTRAQQEDLHRAAGDQEGVHSSRDLVHNVRCTQKYIPADVHVGTNLQEILADVLIKTGRETLLRLLPRLPTRDGGQEDDCARLQPARQHPGPGHLPTPPLHSDERTPCNLDSDGIWDGKWTVMVKLKEDLAALYGIHHPPSSFSLGRDSGYLYYPGQSKLCNKCSKLGHTTKDCTVQVCKNCKREGHTARACKEEAPCNLCGAVGCRFKDCPQRAKSYAQAARWPNLQGEWHKKRLPRPAFQSQHPERPRKLGGGEAPGRSKSNLTRAPPRPWSHRAQKKKCLPSLRVGQQTTLPNPPLRSRKKGPGWNRSAGKGTVPHK